MADKSAKKELSEQWFEQYLADHGLGGADDHHPDLGRAGRRPDYRVTRGAEAAICEVKEFTTSKLDERFASTPSGQVFTVSAEVEFGAARRAISRAAEQLKDHRDSGEALAVVLANPRGLHIPLETADDVIATMYGNQGVSIKVNLPEGESDPGEAVFLEDGALTAKHRYISAVITLHRRTHASDAMRAWNAANRHRWDLEDSAKALQIATDARDEPEARAAAATPGVYYAARVYSTISTAKGQAVPVPRSLFNGPHDQYWALNATGALELVHGELDPED